MIERAAHLFWRVTFARYIVASAAALATDLSCFLILLHLGSHPVIASAEGYCFGVITHWIISSRLVFTHRQRPISAQRRKQKMLFVASTVVGLALTSVIVGLGSHLGIDPRLAKLVAIAVSFQITYLLRSIVVFA